MKDLEDAVNDPTRSRGPKSHRDERISEATNNALLNNQIIEGKLLISGEQLARPFASDGLVDPRNSASSSVKDLNNALKKIGSEWKLVPVHTAIYVWGKNK